MERKQKLILGIFLGLVLVLFIFFVFILKNNKPQPKENNIIIENTTEKNEVMSKPVTKVQNERNEIVSTARGFIEIYGSFSNSSEFSNIKELYPFMTDNLKDKMEKIVESGVQNKNDFFTKSTRVINTGLLKFNDGDVVANVNVEVVETLTDSFGANNIKNKVMVVNLKKELDKWKVDALK